MEVSIIKNDYINFITYEAVEIKWHNCRIIVILKFI